MSKVGIITRTKDRAVFLKRAIKSVSDQTVDDYTHVIVNDGGDKAVINEVVGSFDENVRQRIKLFHRETASGAPDTIFNESIDRIDSTYVVIHDDDDTWHPEFLERVLPILESGSMGVVARTDRVYENINGNNIVFKKSQDYMPDLTAISLYRQCYENQLMTISFIYQRKAYEKVGKYDSTLPVTGDWEFGIRFLREYDVEYLDPGFALAYYHQRKNVNDDSFARHSHRKYVTQVANNYLREDLRKGSLGLGYIISKLKYDMDARNNAIKKMLPKAAIKLIKKRLR